MLRVPTFVAPSRIAGMGLFAGTYLPAGTIIWEFTEGVDWRMPREDMERFPEPYRTRLRHYVYLDETGVFVLCGDNARFMNHADEPNCEDPDGEHTITLREIRAGDELTCDYRQIDVESRANGLGFHDGD
ncbi:MAG: SET domain-containing protein [Gemmatimonadota bacterium]